MDALRPRLFDKMTTYFSGDVARLIPRNTFVYVEKNDTYDL